MEDRVCLSRVNSGVTDLLRLKLPCNRDAPCLARDALAELEAIAPVRDDARLIATELVTNAVRHSGCAPEDTIEMCAKLHRNRLLISVSDPGVSGKSARVRRDPDPERGGFGLRVVERIAQRWGAERPNGLHVWAELALGD